MSDADATEGSVTRWHGLTVALLDGLVAASVMFFLITALRTPGLDPPPESAALFLVAATAGVVSHRLFEDGGSLGYAAAMLTGGFVPVVVALIVTGTYGPAGPRTNPVGPIAYVALAVAVFVMAGIAWRKRTASRRTARFSSTS
jgi:hypothetical protein